MVRQAHFFLCYDCTTTPYYDTPLAILCLPKEQWLNYAIWLRICQLFTLLTGVIFSSLKELSHCCIGSVLASHLIEHAILSILPISDF